MDPGSSDKGRAIRSGRPRIEAAHRPQAADPLAAAPLPRNERTAGRKLGRRPAIEPRVAEIPSPIEDVAERGPWLRRLMAAWTEALTPENTGNGRVDLSAWRQSVVDALTERTEDTVIFSHFIAINVAAGWATGDNRLVAFRPDNCSVTILETSGTALTLIEQGREADTKVN